MPKRPNPFGDASPLQFKSHIAQKDVDMGVEKSRNMGTVYEKTKNMLFEGSRRNRNSSFCCNSALEPVSLELGSRGLLPSKPQPGQMTLDSCGTLFSCQQPHAADQQMDIQDEDSMSALGNNNNNNVMPCRAAVQMQIDPTGKLCRADEAPGNPMGRACHSCSLKCTVSTAARPCNFCDKATCTRCLRPCAFCGSIVCQVCSTINYDQCIERIFCLQCTS